MRFFKRGLKISAISELSPFFRAGLRKGDLILEINGQNIEDELDFHYLASDSLLIIKAVRHNCKYSFEVYRAEGEFSAVDFFEKPIRRCSNHCIFCFIDQMPPNLRKGLYIKDEDLRHSFFKGNYVTLSNATHEDFQKVFKIGLSPLYISVHAADMSVRNKMLGNRHAPEIMEQLKLLKNNGIQFHTQVVVCPGYNDGNVLIETVEKLFLLNDALLSIAVVPVGLTRFRKKPLKSIDSHNARLICNEMTKISDCHAAADKRRRLFLADEMFIKAGLKIPTNNYYEGYPQIENGVGLVRKLLEEWKKIKKELSTYKFRKKRILFLTSVSAYAFLKKIFMEMTILRPELNIFITFVPNTFFGESVTVAGLITAGDVKHTIRGVLKDKKFDEIYVPGVMINNNGFTIDGCSLSRIGKEIGIPVGSVSSLQDAIEALCSKRLN